MGIRGLLGNKLASKAEERYAKIVEKRKDRKDSKAQLTRISRWMNDCASIPSPEGSHRTRYDEDHSSFDAIREQSAEASSRLKRDFLKQAIGGQKGALKGTTYEESMKNPHSRTPLWAALEVDKVVVGMSKYIDSRLENEELDWRNKVGPYFKVDYTEWHNKVAALFAPLKGTSWNEDTKLAFHLAAVYVGEHLLDYTGKIVPLTFEQGDERVKRGRNGGAPFFTKKWNSPENSDMLDFYMAKAQAVIDGETDLSLPAVLFSRVTPGGRNPKMRPVECPEGATKWVDVIFQAPITDAFKKHYATFGYNGVEEMSENFSECFNNVDHFYSLDFSAFDASVREEMMDAIFDVVFPIIMDLTDEHKSLLARLKRYYMTCGLLTPTGLLESDSVHGLFSGMGLTSVIGTISNLIAVKFAMDDCGYGVDDWVHFAFGDDTVLASASKVDLADLSKSLAKIGFKLNVDKTHISEEAGDYARIDFLGAHFFRNDCRAVRTLMRALPGMIFQKNDSENIESLADALLYDRKDKGVIDELRMKVTFMGVVSKLANLYAHEHFAEIVEVVAKAVPAHWRAKLFASPEEVAVILGSEAMDHPVELTGGIREVYSYIQEVFEF